MYQQITGDLMTGRTGADKGRSLKGGLEPCIELYRKRDSAEY